MTAPLPVLLDTCTVLSLYASRHMEPILHANLGPFLIAEAVLYETLYVHVIVDDAREKEPVSLDPLLTAGILMPVEPETEQEFQTLIDLSQHLDAGEAMTCALAIHRGYRIATDEKKTIRLLGNQIPIIGTLDLVRAWVDQTGVPPMLVREVLAAIEDRGYVPGDTHAHYAWWAESRGGR